MRAQAGLESIGCWVPLGIGTEAKEQCPCVPGAPVGSAWSTGLVSLHHWESLGIGTETKGQCPCAPGAPVGSGWSAEPTANACASWSGIARPLGIARCRHIALNRSKNVGADALIGPPRNAVPAAAKPELPGNPREVRTTFSAENGCCAPRTPADIGCLLRNSIQNLPFCQRYAGKTVHLCCRSPHGERGLKSSGMPEPILWPSSLPPRGAWIEISSSFRNRSNASCRSPHGERGLKSNEASISRT